MGDPARQLFELAAGLATEKSLDRMLDRILDAMLSVSGAECGFVILLEDGEPDVQRARPPEARPRVSWTILGRVLAENRPILLADAMADPDFSGVRSIQRERVRSVCALPLRTPREAVGAVYLDHRASARVAPGLLDTLHAFAGLAAVAIQNARRAAPAVPDAHVPHPAIVAVDLGMKRVLRLVRRFAGLPYPVYIHGESGTGKELVARAIHDGGPRKREPFVAVNCAAIAGPLAESELFGHVRGAFTGADRDRAGLFEQAHKGTLFLDELEAMPPMLQEKLLRVLQDGVVRRVGGGGMRADVRIVSASNEDIETLPRFRRDLYYRLNVLRIDVPPLRKRRGELPALVDHLLARIARETRTHLRPITPEGLERLGVHCWPGNVRELENALRRAWAESPAEALDAGDFDFLVVRSVPPREPALAVEDYLRMAVEQLGPRLSNAELADRLGISRKTLWKKKKQWGIR